MKTHKINYNVKSGLIDLLTDLTSHSKPEMWANLADLTNICIERITKKNMRNSWTTKIYPGTRIKVKVKVDTWSGSIYNAEISVANTGGYEKFTHKQVEEYIEGVLLGE